MVADSTAAVAWAALIVSVLTFLLGLLAYFTTDRRVGKIEEERRAEEVEARAAAIVTVSLEKEQRAATSVAYFLVLENVGHAQARGVTLEFPSEESDLLLRTGEHLLPLDLAPGQRFRIPALIHSGTPLAVKVEVRWADSRGPRAATITLATV